MHGFQGTFRTVVELSGEGLKQEGERDSRFRAPRLADLRMLSRVPRVWDASDPHTNQEIDSFAGLRGPLPIR